MKSALHAGDRKTMKFDAGKLFGVKAFEGVMLDGYAEPGPNTPKRNGYKWTQETLTAFVAAHLGNKNLYLVGPQGCGKTAGVVDFYAALNYEVYRQQHFEGMEAEDPLYNTRIVDGETVEEPGPLWLAALRGGVYLADELPNGNAYMNIVYNSILEPCRELRLTRMGGMRVPVSPMFRFVATGNTGLEEGNSSGLYVGAQRQNAALGDRFVVWRCDYPPMDVEAGILLEKVQGLEKEEAQAFCLMAEFLRNNYKAVPQKYPLPCSTRTLIDCAEMALLANDVTFGIKMTMLNKLEAPEHIEVLKEAYEKAFGEAAKRIPLL